MGKRSPGHIEQLPSGSWRVKVYGGTDPLTGREIRLRKTCKTERAAQIELGKLLEQAAAGRLPASAVSVDGMRRSGPACDHGSMPPRGPELPSRQVEDDLRRRCAAGEWKPGERLPAVADLVQQYGVARNTVTKALRRLADDGLVEIVPSWGTFRARS